MARPNLGAEFASSIGSLARAYVVDEDEMAKRVYAVAEQIHQHYCMARGFVSHSESRPDQHIAISVLGSLAGSGWWLSTTRETAVGGDDSTEG